WCRGPDDPGREGETADDPTHDLNSNADRKCPSIGYVRAVDRRSGPAQLGISYSDGLRQLLTQHLEIQSVRKFKCLHDFEGLRGCSRYDYHLHPGGTKASCVVVSFSSETFVSTNEQMGVQATLDGSTSFCLPIDNIFSVSGSGERALHGICPSVGPGSHS